jgi:hypothetical protein
VIPVNTRKDGTADRKVYRSLDELPRTRDRIPPRLKEGMRAAVEDLPTRRSRPSSSSGRDPLPPNLDAVIGSRDRERLRLSHDAPSAEASIDSTALAGVKLG